MPSKSPNNPASHQSSGFTLIEMLIVIVLMVVIGGAILSLQYFVSQTQVVATRNYLDTDQANTSLFSLARELRTARPSENGAYSIESADDNELIFYSDLDFDSQAERLRYTLTGTNLERGVIEPMGQPATYPVANEKVKILSKNARNLTIPLFTYYNGDWPEDTQNNPLATPPNISDIKLIKITLRINTEENQPDKDYLLESFTQIRTLKENL